VENYHRISGASELLDIPKPTIQYLIKKDLFPKGIRISKKLRLWPESELKEWLETKRKEQS